MKKLALIFLSIIMLIYEVKSQNFINAYTNRTATSTTGFMTRLATDHMMNVINSTTYNGTISVGNATYTGNGPTNSLIVKRDDNDSVLWSKSLTCGGNTIVGGLYVDNYDNLYVTGFFGAYSMTSTTLDCNPFPLVCPAGMSSFILKYSPSGNLLWSRSIQVATSTGAVNADLFKMSGNGTNKVIITSPYIGIPSQNIGTSTIDTLAGNLFFAIIDDNGNWQSATMFGGANNVHISMSVAVANNNDVFFAGVFKGNLGLGSAGILTTLTSSPQDFVCKADANGNFIWGMMLESSSWWRTEVLADNNDVFLFGSFGGTLHLGSTTLNTNYYSTYFSKISNAGNFIWAKKYGTESTTFYAACRNNNSVFLTGVTSSSVTANQFDTLNLTYTTSLPPANTYSSISYLVQSDLNGNAIKGAFCSFNFSTLNIANMACNSGSVYITGLVPSSAAFGNYVITGNPPNAANFVARYTENANLISGSTFYDFNANNIFDAGDVDATVKLDVVNTNVTSTIMSGGHYRAGVGTGNYTTSISGSVLYYNSSPANYLSSFATLTNQEDSLNDFILQPIPNQNDLKIDLVVGQFRPGFNGVAFLTLSNVGTTSKSGQMNLELNNSDIFILSCNPSAININGNNAAFSYSLNPTQSITYTISYSVGVAAVLGSAIQSVATAFDNTDLTPINNTDTINSVITGSFDPNVKLVFPEGNIPPSFISNGDELEYTILFQNTGNDTAFTVVITDEISSLLQISSFELVSASHPVVVNINDNKIWFRFYNILLPDSNVNEPLSHGYVKYKITPKSTCVVGNVIENTASIYFDYNIPVMTNTTQTKIEIPSGINENNFSTGIYPNPISGNILNIVSDSPIQNIVIYNSIGEIVLIRKVENKLVENINATELRNGVYFVDIFSDGVKVVKQLVRIN